MQHDDSIIELGVTHRKMCNEHNANTLLQLGYRSLKMLPNIFIPVSGGMRNRAAMPVKEVSDDLVRIDIDDLCGELFSYWVEERYFHEA